MKHTPKCHEQDVKTCFLSASGYLSVNHQRSAAGKIFKYIFIIYIGRKTLWWNQRARLQKLQAAAMRQVTFKQMGVSDRSSPRQAICPFCYKGFYDKSTMNRHVSKRVCLGIQFQSTSFVDVKPIVPVDQVISHLQSTFKSSRESSPAVSESNGDGKQSRTPCPYCKKLLKGKRGVRKHINFYGCPMAEGAQVTV